jgi:hypothetical protein
MTWEEMAPCNAAQTLRFNGISVAGGPATSLYGAKWLAHAAVARQLSWISAGIWFRTAAILAVANELSVPGTFPAHFSRTLRICQFTGARRMDYHSKTVGKAAANQPASGAGDAEDKIE